MNTNGDKILTMYKELVKLRKELDKKFGNEPLDVAGKCITASDELAARLNKLGIKAKAYQVWALYEDFEDCSDYCYEEHWIVVAEASKGQRIYLDPTYNQFQWAIESLTLPKIYMGCVLPNWMLPREPGRETLKRCGWTDYFNYGDYSNCFDYWSYLEHPKNKELENYIKSRLSKSKRNYTNKNKIT